MIDFSKYITLIVGSVGFIILYAVVTIGWDIYKFRQLNKRFDTLERLIKRKVSK